MAMNSVTLATAIKAALGLNPATDAEAIAAWDAISAEIISHIQANAVVTVASVSGVTVGTGVSGPGTGTIA